jgi:hypothetical protein
VSFTNFVATMVGLKGTMKETISVRRLMNRGNTDIGVEELECGFIREAVVPLLEKLENFFAREIAGTVDEHASSLRGYIDFLVSVIAHMFLGESVYVYLLCFTVTRDNSTVGGFKADKSEKPIRYIEILLVFSC